MRDLRTSPLSTADIGKLAHLRNGSNRKIVGFDIGSPCPVRLEGEQPIDFWDKKRWREDGHWHFADGCEWDIVDIVDQ